MKNIVLVGLESHNGDALPNVALDCDLSGFNNSLAVLLYRALCNGVRKHKELTFLEKLILKGEGKVKLGAFHPKDGDGITINASDLTIYIDNEVYALSDYINSEIPKNKRILAAIGYTQVIHYPIYGKNTVIDLGSMSYQFFNELKEYKDSGSYNEETHNRLKTLGEDTVRITQELEGRLMQNIQSSLDETLEEIKASDLPTTL